MGGLFVGLVLVGFWFVLFFSDKLDFQLLGFCM